MEIIYTRIIFTSFAIVKFKIFIFLWVRLSPFPRVESRFNTHNQNAFANVFRNAFLELLRLSSISQNHDYEYTVRPRKTDPWNKGMLWPSAGMAGVYDCSHTFIVKYDHYAFELCIVEVPPVMHRWAALFSGLNVRIHLFHFKEGRYNNYCLKMMVNYEDDYLKSSCI